MKTLLLNPRLSAPNSQMLQPQQRFSQSTLRLSDVAGDLVSELTFLEESLRLDLVNYSALARMLKPAVDAKMGDSVSPEAITMALRRLPPPGAPRSFGDLYGVISQCKASVQSDMASVHYPYSEDLAQKINHFKQEINYEGEKMYVIQRSDEISIITHTKFLHLLQKLAEKVKPFEGNYHLALLTISYSEQGHHTPGTVNFFTRIINEGQVNLFGVFSSFSKVSFLVDEKFAAELFDRMTRAINGAKDIAKSL